MTLEEFISEFNQKALLDSADTCEAINELEEIGVVDSIALRFNYLRRYVKRMLQLDFEGTESITPISQSIDILRRYHNGNIKTLPNNVPTSFLPKMWKNVVRDSNGNIRPKYWEIGLYYMLKKTLASGDLYLAKSRTHQYFWDTVYKEEKWEIDRKDKYEEMKLPTVFDPIEADLSNRFNEVAQHTQNSLDNNTFAQVTKDELVLKKDDALVIPQAVNKLRKQITAQLPSIRIEQLIAEVDKLSGFSNAFTPFNDQYRQNILPKSSIHAAIVAHATNIGLYGMGHSSTGISTEMIKNASQVYVRPETIAESNNLIIKHHLSYLISKVFGDGSWSNSDAQRYGIQASSPLSAYCPRFFGYYDKAISIYTHIADTFDVFNTQVISCSEREAAYVLSGLLTNKSNVNPQFHCTDTHGFTEHIFALCHLLGFDFRPRLKDLTEQRLYKIKDSQDYGKLEPLFVGSINMDLIKENWDQIVRIVAALKNGHIPAHIIIQKLANRSDNVAKAIKSLGRIVKTIYILRYIADPQLRYKVHLQLNRGESRHHLAKTVCFANHGVFKTNVYEEIMNPKFAV